MLLLNNESNEDQDEIATNLNHWTEEKQLNLVFNLHTTSSCPFIVHLESQSSSFEVKFFCETTPGKILLSDTMGNYPLKIFIV